MSTTHSLASPDPLWPNSPTRSCDPLVLEEVHSHLVRSPPPVNWPESDRGCSFPLSPRSCGTFSPDSSDGLELDCANNNPASVSSNYYVRSQSEEHILSPCRDLLRAGMHGPSPVNLPPARGATPDPDFLLMTTSLHAGMGDASSPRTPLSSVTPRPGSSQQQRQKIRRNHTLNLSSEHFLSSSSNVDPATSVSTYAMSSSGFPSSGHHRRSLGGRPVASKKLSVPPPPPASAGIEGGFFSSASLRPGGGSGRQRRRRTSESQAVTSARQQDAKSMENLQVRLIFLKIHSGLGHSRTEPQNFFFTISSLIPYLRFKSDYSFYWK